MADIEAIVLLVDSAYRGDVSRQGWTTEADIIEGQRTDACQVRELLEQKNQSIILCEDNNQLLASVHLDRRENYAYLGMFAVKPGLQGKGTGRVLLAYAEAKVFKEWQCEWLEMTVIKQRKELIAWYERNGYSMGTEERPFPYGDERFGLPKRDDLVLGVLKKMAAEYS